MFTSRDVQFVEDVFPFASIHSSSSLSDIYLFSSSDSIMDDPLDTLVSLSVELDNSVSD